ncbi:MAG: valine--tRNA ligase, partial [Burkholderiales bacterium]
TVAPAKDLVNAGRNLRSEAKVPPKDRIPFYIVGKPSAAMLTSTAALLRVSDLRIVAELPASDSPVAVVGAHKIMPHIEVDPAAERDRVAKEVQRVEGEIAKARTQLAKPSFVERAPAPVVQQVRDRLSAFQATLDKLNGKT